MSRPLSDLGQPRFDPVQLREIPENRVVSRVVTLLIGTLLAGSALGYLYVHRLPAQEVALGDQTRQTRSIVSGIRMNSWTSDDADSFYRSDAWKAGAHEGVFLGNSMIYAINQPREGDQIAPWHLSTILGWNVFGLNLPNANCQEYLVLQEFAFLRRNPDWVVVPLIFDKFRNDGVRAELSRLSSPELLRSLNSTTVGLRLAAEMGKNRESGNKDLQGTSRDEHSRWLLGVSMQKLSEDYLESLLTRIWPLWAGRADMRAAATYGLYRLRNFVFRIDSRSVRPVLAAPFHRNMEALEDLLLRNAKRGVHTLVYIAPLRRDYPSPYEMDKYEGWKRDVQQMAAAHGAIFKDLDRAVPDDLWGRIDGGDVDFMHYQGAAHRLMAERIADVIQGVNGGADRTGGD